MKSERSMPEWLGVRFSSEYLLRQYSSIDSLSRLYKIYKILIAHPAAIDAVFERHVPQSSGQSHN